MIGDHGDRSEEDARSRRFLEELLAQCRQANWHGGQTLITLIEEALAKLPPEAPPAPDTKFAQSEAARAPPSDGPQPPAPPPGSD
jgi:hypothetical protein